MAVVVEIVGGGATAPPLVAVPVQPVTPLNVVPRLMLVYEHVPLTPTAVKVPLARNPVVSATRSVVPAEDDPALESSVTGTVHVSPRRSFQNVACTPSRV